MTPERWQRIRTLFDSAIEAEPTQRESWLREHCPEDEDLRREVLRLLASDEKANGSLANQVAQGVVEFFAAEETPATRMAGPYRLLRELGRGGMGAVYLGERADGQYEGEVAVKLLRPGMDTEFFLARFKRERQALARLQHPNIARLIDSGTSDDGLPYIVMERVEGVAINDYVRNQRLSTEQILRLFLGVCRAVSHAHQRLIVHRDLKPRNILVEPNGTPRLLDFGICKLLEDLPGAETSTSAELMTPAYASPEQVRGETITVASDIYALGAVLYELLTGRPPHQIEKPTPQNIYRAVCEDEVRVPSGIAEAGLSRWQSDLDTILLKALQKDPRRRYESVEQFAEDIRRVLENEPVLARPDTMTYRAGKFVRRHTAAVAVTLGIVLALSVGLVAYARQARLARQQAAEARSLANAMMFSIHDQIRNLPGSLAARESLVRTGLQYLDQLAVSVSNDASLRNDLASAYLRMGEIQGSALESNRGDTEGSLASFRKGLAVLEPEGKDRGADLVRMEILRRIALGIETRNSAAALEDIERSIQIGASLRARYPDDETVSKQVARAYGSAGLVFRRTQNTRRVIESSRAQREVLAKILERHPEDRDARGEAANALTNLGTAQASVGQLREAKKSFEQTIADWETLSREAPHDVAFRRNLMLSYSHLGDVLGNPAFPNLKDTKGAQQAFVKMVETAEQLHRASPDSQRAAVDLGMALARLTSLPGSSDLDQCDRSIKLLEAALARDPRNATIGANAAAQHERAGDLLAEKGDTVAAKTQYTAALKLLQPNPPQLQSIRTVISVHRKLAEQAARRGESSTALQLARKAVEAGESAATRAKAPVIKLNRAKAYEAMSSVLSLLGQPEEAERWAQNAGKAYRELAGEDPASAPIAFEMERFLKSRPRVPAGQ